MSGVSQFLVSPESCVEDMLLGVKSTFPGLSVDVKSRVIFNSKRCQNRKVGILSGGGSGHEPFAAGFVGEGMLTAAVAGSVFASPPPSHILTTICNVATISPGGVLVIFNNYTGDVLNFGLALERAKCQGYNVKCVVVDEDCAIDAPEGAGKRGLCGCLFVIKIAGGLASMSKSLEDVYGECVAVKNHSATLGVTIKPCNMPGSGPMFHMGEGLMEMGVGIHGEAGNSKTKLQSADKVVSVMIDKLCKTLHVQAGSKVCSLVNNLGGCSQLEVLLVAGQVFSQLEARGVQVVRQYTGTLMTALDMAGVQVSLLLVPEEKTSWLECLDAPTEASAWPGNSLSRQHPWKTELHIEKKADSELEGVKVTDVEAEMLKKCLRAVAEALQQNESRLNELDSGCGDGDTGSTLRRMADGILQELESLPVKYPGKCLERLSGLAEDMMGGTSGALYSLLFVGAVREAPQWGLSWQGALDLATTYSKARVGHRTMFDALIPACEVFSEELSRGRDWEEALGMAVEAADLGCERTRHYKPLYGRASYVDSSYLADVDAGAFAVTVWLHALQSQLLLQTTHCE